MPTAEVFDGVDNDCNGIVDDVPTRSSNPRMLLLIPTFFWAEAPEEVGTIEMILDQWGIPYDTTHDATQWSAALTALSSYSAVYIPGYLPGWAVSGTPRLSLEQFARDGGVVIVTKPIPDITNEALTLAGIADSVRSANSVSISVDAEAPALASFDSAEERRILLTDDPVVAPADVWAFTPQGDTTALARAHTAAGASEAVITRRPLGQGAVYAIGHDLHGFDHYRCYINCFEPAGDLLGLMLRDALREGSAGHVVLKHTVPGLEDTALLLSHDIDAPDSHNAGIWGEAGALQMARVEQGFGARGTYFITTDYAAGYFNPDTLRALCQLGMCPLGAHSVYHDPTFGQLSRGTCEETPATYDPRVAMSVCGEVRVSQTLVEQSSAQSSTVWRSPFLAVPPDLFSVLGAQGFVGDSSYAIGDFKMNLPISLTKAAFNQHVFQHQPLHTLPIVLEDGLGGIDEFGQETREELQEKNFPLFMTQWQYAMLRNADNHAVTMVLIHPSYGQGVGPENLPFKMRAAENLLTAATRRGAVLESFASMMQFWRARERTTLEVTYSPVAGYTGLLETGDLAAPKLALEFGDNIQSFDCAECGSFVIRGNRVLLTGPLPAGKQMPFSAHPVTP